ncbi:MAG: DUF5960 family protein [Streptococcus parasanguinis]
MHEDDILTLWQQASETTFVSRHTKSRDRQDHYFYFKVSTLPVTGPCLRLCKAITYKKIESSSDRERG